MLLKFLWACLVFLVMGFGLYGFGSYMFPNAPGLAKVVIAAILFTALVCGERLFSEGSDHENKT